MSGMVRIQDDFHNGVHSLFPEIMDAFFARQPFDVYGVSILMPSETAPENVVEGVQVPTDPPIQNRCEHLFYLVIEAIHVGEVAAVDGEFLPLRLFFLHDIPSFSYHFIQQGSVALHQLQMGAQRFQSVPHHLGGEVPVRCDSGGQLRDVLLP